jgi:hypothetical protein
MVNMPLPAPAQKVPVIAALNDHNTPPRKRPANSQCEKADLPDGGNNLVSKRGSGADGQQQ